MAFIQRNPIIGGGSTFAQLVAQLLATLGQERQARATLGADLLSNLLNLQLEANRRPISLVNQLLLSGKVGSILPLSQASQEELARFQTPAQNDLLNRMLQQTAIYSQGALTDAERRFLSLTPEQQARLGQLTPQQLAGLAKLRPPRRMARGGALAVDPALRKSARSQIAGPAVVVDRSGVPVASLGERARELIRVKPVAGRVGQHPLRPVSLANLPLFPGARIGQPVGTPVGQHPLRPGSLANLPFPGARIGQPVGTGVPVVLPPSPTRVALAYRQELQDRLAQEPRDVRFRAKELVRATGTSLSPDQVVNIARNPAGFEAWVGQTTEPRAAAARLLAGALARDLRFSDPFVRALSLGRAPRPNELTMAELLALPPDLQESLFSVIGEGLLPQFLFELGQFTPTGTNVIGNIVGGLAA